MIEIPNHTLDEIKTAFGRPFSVNLRNFFKIYSFIIRFYPIHKPKFLSLSYQLGIPYMSFMKTLRRLEKAGWIIMKNGSIYPTKGLLIRTDLKAQVIKTYDLITQEDYLKDRELQEDPLNDSTLFIKALIEKVKREEITEEEYKYLEILTSIFRAKRDKLYDKIIQTKYERSL